MDTHDDAHQLLMRDVSRAGHELGRTQLTGLPSPCTLRELLRHRVHADVAAYNLEPGPVFEGLVQPADAIRHTGGFRMQRPRPLDADLLIAAAEEAVGRGLLRVQVGAATLGDLDAELVPDDHDEVLAVLERPVVAQDA